MKYLIVDKIRAALDAPIPLSLQESLDDLVKRISTKDFPGLNTAIATSLAMQQIMNYLSACTEKDMEAIDPNHGYCTVLASAFPAKESHEDKERTISVRSTVFGSSLGAALNLRHILEERSDVTRLLQTIMTSDEE